MALTISDIINICGVCASAFLSIMSLVIAIAVFRYAKKKDKVIGPVFSVFDIKLLNSDFTEEELYRYKPGTKTFIAIEHTVINDGDRTTRFEYDATLKLDIQDTDGNFSADTQKIQHGSELINIFKPGDYRAPYIITFYFENPDKEVWTTAVLRFKGYFYDQNRKEVTIDSGDFVIFNRPKLK